MRLLKIFSVLVLLTGAAVVAMVAGPSVAGHIDSTVLAQDGSSSRAVGQGHDDIQARTQLNPVDGRRGRIGVSARDVETAEAERQKLAGAFIEDVQPGGPADKAGLKRGDVIVGFDGENVRSARQFARLVQETPPGRTVTATIVRDGRRSDVQVTTSGLIEPDVVLNGDRLREQLGPLADRLPPFDFNFDLDMQGWGSSRGRLGVTVEELTSQLATYFGAKEGVLVAAVAEGSPAEKAGMRAGDVITRVNGENIRTRQQLTRLLNDAKDDHDVTLSIVRDKKESSVKAQLESSRSRRSTRAGI